MRNEELDAALNELKAAGISDPIVSRGGRHLQLRWQLGNGAIRFFSVSTTPSDRRGPRNARAEIRRLLKADGLLVKGEPAAAPAAPAKALPAWQIEIEGLKRRVAELEAKLSTQT